MKKTPLEARRQESGRGAGYFKTFPFTNICITRLTSDRTYRGGGEASPAGRSRASSCGTSSLSPPHLQFPGSSFKLVEQVTGSPLVGSRSPSPAIDTTCRTMTADSCRCTFQLSCRTKTTEPAAVYGGGTGTTKVEGIQQQTSGQLTVESVHLLEKVSSVYTFYNLAIQYFV